MRIIKILQNIIKSKDSLIRSLHKSDFIQKIAETFATRILLIGLGVITSVLVARILGPEGKGEIAVATTMAGIGVQFLNLGLHSSNTYFASKDSSLLSPLLGNSIFTSIIIGGGTALLFYIFLLFKPGFAPIHGTLLVYALLWVPFGLALLFSQNLLIAVNRIREYNKIELVSKILNIIFIFFLFSFNGVSVNLVFLMGLVTLFIGMIWTHLILFRLINDFPSPSLKLFKSNFRYGLKAYLSAFFAFLVIRLDLLMIKFFLDDEQTGLYSVAANLGDLIYMLPIVIGTILFPKLSAMKTRLLKWKYTKVTTLYSGLTMFILIVFFALILKPIITLFYGSNFLPAAGALYYLLPGIFFLSISTILAQFLNSIGFPKTIVLFWLIATAINITLNYFAIPIYGIIGASLVSTISYFFIFFSVLLLIKRNLSSYEEN